MGVTFDPKRPCSQSGDGLCANPCPTLSRRAGAVSEVFNLAAAFAPPVFDGPPIIDAAAARAIAKDLDVETDDAFWTLLAAAQTGWRIAIAERRERAKLADDAAKLAGMGRG